MANLTDEVALQYSELHICYELDMLQWSTVALLNMNPDPGGNVPSLIFSKNALLETFAIHSRNLIDFLYPPNKVRKTDVTIKDYINDKANLKIPECQKPLDEARTKANKQVAHLTTDRIDYEITGKEWGFLDIYNAIIDQFTAYKPHLVASRISPMVIERLKKIQIANNN